MSFFRAYDIRGTESEGLKPEFAERLGHVLAEQYRPRRVLIGRDMRTSSPALESALIRGLNEQGVDAIRIGLCSTPLFNVSMGLANGAYDLGIMVTASHNPAEYNGFKMIDGNMMPIGGGSGMEQVRDRFMSDEPFEASEKKGTVTDDPSALPSYLNRIFADIDLSDFPRMNIAIDAGNGMAGYVLPELIRRMPCIEAIPLYWELDGRFPNHEANPLKSETLDVLSRTVREQGCAFGVAYDGDCDRIGFVDENGDRIPGDILTAVLARSILHDHPGELILRDVRCSWSVEETIAEAGGHSEMCRVGHAFIKRQLRERNAIFAGELSMHFYYRQIWGMESGDLTLLLLIREIARTGKPLSELWKPFLRYAKSDEINTSVADAGLAIAHVREQYAAHASSVSDMDGIRMEFGVSSDGTRQPNAWWFSLRASNTEPVVRLIVEAMNEGAMEEKKNELLGMIRASAGSARETIAC